MNHSSGTTDKARRSRRGVAGFLVSKRPERSRLRIAFAVPPGSRLTWDTRQWLTEVKRHADCQDWRENRRHNFLLVCRRLALHMDWHDRIARPGHDLLRGPHQPGCRGVPVRQDCPGPHRRDGAITGCKCGERCCPGRLSSDTVGRVVAHLRQAGLLGLVAAGTLPVFQSFLHRGDGPSAAVYVLCVLAKTRRAKPAKHTPGLEVLARQELTADPSRSPEVTGPPRVRAREARASLRSGSPPERPTAAAQPARAGPAAVGWGCSPSSTDARRDAAEAIRVASSWARSVTSGWLAWLAGPYWDAGWTVRDVLWAIDHDPRGRGYGFSAAPRHPVGLIRSRLAAWRTPAGGVRESPSQSAAAGAAAAAADQAERHAANARVAAGRVDPASYAEAIRRRLNWSRGNDV